MSNWPRVSIMGGSIGGLTAALALRTLGCEVDVYERSATALAARGAGIGLHPMTVRYFTEHDPLDRDKIAIDVPWLRFLHPDGSCQYEEIMNYQFSSWNTIYRSLLRNFADAHYHLDQEITDFSQHNNQVQLTFANGMQRATDLLVCADGISSTARTLLQPDAQPLYAGYVAWRGTVPESQLSAATFNTLKDAITYGLLPAGHILIYPIPSLSGGLKPGERLANFVWYHNYQVGTELDQLMTDSSGEQRAISLPPGTVAPHYLEWLRDFAQTHMAPQIAEVVLKTEQPFVQVIYDIEVTKMAFERIALMGDAAFAVRPHAAAGTAKACADAWNLCDALTEHSGEVLPALQQWEQTQLELGQQLLQRTRDIGDRSQFKHNWVPGDPSLRFGLYGPGQ